MWNQSPVAILAIAVAAVVAIFFNIVGAFILTHLVNLVFSLGDKFNLTWACLFIVIFVLNNADFKRRD